MASRWSFPASLARAYLPDPDLPMLPGNPACIAALNMRSAGITAVTRVRLLAIGLPPFSTRLLKGYQPGHGRGQSANGLANSKANGLAYNRINARGQLSNWPVTCPWPGATWRACRDGSTSKALPNCYKTRVARRSCAALICPGSGLACLDGIQLVIGPLRAVQEAAQECPGKLCSDLDSFWLGCVSCRSQSRSQPRQCVTSLLASHPTLP